MDALGLGHAPTIVDGSPSSMPSPRRISCWPPRRSWAVAGDCWCIGDSTWDMEAAAAAGMTAVGVTAGAAVPGEALREAGAGLVTETLMELRRSSIAGAEDRSSWAYGSTVVALGDSASTSQYGRMP